MPETVADPQAGGVFADVVGQPAAVETCRIAVAAAQAGPGRAGPAMTHAWLFTGPPGTQSSVSRCFISMRVAPARQSIPTTCWFSGRLQSIFR